MVSWVSPDDPDQQVHGNILSYTITCGAFTMNVPASEEAMDVSFDGLLPYTTYSCCISIVMTEANSSATCQEGVTLEEGKMKVLFSSSPTLHSLSIHCKK